MAGYSFTRNYMKKTTVSIRGMHCSSCEILISDELLKVPNVRTVTVSHAKGEAIVRYKNNLNMKLVDHAVKNAGYTIGKEESKPLISQDPNDYFEVIVMILIIGFIALIASDIGLFKLTELASNNLASLPIVFLIGLTAGVSTCAALVGGLVLGASARFAEKNPHATALQKFTPHVFFNIGRIVSFFVLGGAIGAVGSVFQMSLGVMGLLTIVVGLVMLVFGAQLTQLFPRLSQFNFSIPSGIARLIGLKEQTEQQYSHKNAAVLGGLTFFLPCGFTQMVQLYAISTADPLTASLTMGTFAIGTTPGLLGIGGLTSVINGAFSRLFFKTVGVVVMLLALFNITNGINLAGLKNSITFMPAKDSNATDVRGATNGDVQVLKAVYTSKNDMQPNTFTIKAGQPVELSIDVKDDGFGCMGSMALPGLSKQVEMLVKDKPMVFAFTPEKPGTYDITCAMGVPRGTITVL
jgi:sulfite exporter TauE/SafE/copper chaperone CopZ